MAEYARREGEGPLGRELCPVLQAEAMIGRIRAPYSNAAGAGEGLGRPVLILAVCLLAACKTTSQSESHLTATAAETLDTQGRVETHVEEAPGRVTTTVEEFAPPENAPQVQIAATPDPNASSVAPAVVRVNGALLRRTVTVEEKGAITTATVADAKSQERGDSEVTASAEQKKSFDFLHGPLLWIGLAVMVAGGIALVLKLRGIL